LVIVNWVERKGPPSLKLTPGVVPLQNVLRVVADPTPVFEDGVYCGKRSAGPESVTVHEFVIVVETLNVDVAKAPEAREAKRAALAASPVPVRVRLRRFIA